MRLVMCAALAFAAGSTGAEDKAEEAKAAVAELGAKAIDKALKVYYTQNNEWPAKLDDVAELLEGGKKALTDPWGKAYQFRIVDVDQPDGSTIQRLYVWTERVVNGKTEVYGNKPPEKKKDDKKP